MKLRLGRLMLFVSYVQLSSRQLWKIAGSESGVSTRGHLVEKRRLSSPSGISSITQDQSLQDIFSAPRPDDASIASSAFDSNDSDLSAPKLSLNHEGASTSTISRKHSLRLRSSDRNITALHGDLLFASPMPSAQWQELLLNTSNDLSALLNHHEQTAYY